MSPFGASHHTAPACAATKGFFVLENCGASARSSCTRCTRPICPRHTMQLPSDPAPLCPECYSAARGEVAPHDDSWPVGYRRFFYWDLTSTTDDPSWWTTFDHKDRDGFDQQLAQDRGEWGDSGDQGHYGDDFDDDAYLDS